MRTAMVVALALLATVVSSGFASTVPAFLWSPGHEISNEEVTGVVNYQTVSVKDLAKTVLTQGQWSQLLCSEKKLQQQVDLGLVFIGRELQSADISRNKNVDPALLNLLKDSYLKSNLSLAFPYVAASEDESMESSLVSGFTETCDNDLELKNIAFLGSCSVQADESRKISDLKSLHDYLVSRKERRLEGHADVIMFCQGESASLSEAGFPSSEGEILSELFRSMEQLEEKYTVLYVSDPSKSIQYPYPRDLERFLAEATNGSSNSTCDGVCQIKSSLLEGLLVGIVLLVILISGLCCMAGIQTPTRFETPHES